MDRPDLPGDHIATTEATTRIRLANGCTSDQCLKMAGELELQLQAYSRGAAIMPIPRNMDDYLAEHRTLRRRAGRAARLGYQFAEIERALHVDEIHEINTSTPERQGRPMSAGYQEAPVYGPNPTICEQHHVYTYGVAEPAGRLVAYTWIYRSGELAMVSTILGHHDHLDAGVMYLLIFGALEQQAWIGPGTLFYNLWNSGTDGLRFYKSRIGLEEGTVSWML
jgi:hypothetical protein